MARTERAGLETLRLLDAPPVRVQIWRRPADLTPRQVHAGAREQRVSKERWQLTDRVVLVTGAGKGIGAAIATTCAEAGADLVITARTESDLRAVGQQVLDRGGRCLELPGDVNDLNFLAHLVDRTISEFGRLDVVVNNAGGSVSRPMLDTSVRDLERAFHFNVSVPFELTRLAVPHLLRSDAAAVVMISSMAGVKATRGSLAHSLSKAAESQLTRLMAAELAPAIRVNAVLPGAVETASLEWWLSQKGPELREGMISRTAMRRNGVPQDIADAVLFLASPASSWVTGKLLEVDGSADDELIPNTQPDLSADAVPVPDKESS
jgi:7-alpha-hydroxysteroid dehydrogenase